MSANLPKKKTRGQIYIDLLITLAILGILTPALFALVVTAYNLVSFTKARITAKHLAQEKIELIRNMPYNQVGTVGGIPAGPLPQEESVQRNELYYHIKISVIYIDDPFDQTAPDDLLPVDYKRARVEVYWGGVAASYRNPVVIVTDIAPRGVETMAGGGTLSILVFDSSGLPVSQANVSIINNEVEPAINLNLKTSNDGRVILPGAPVCTDCYQLTVTKDNYSSERTYSTEELAHPNKPHLNVLESQLTEISFVIDKLSALAVRSVSGRENNFASLPNQSFRLQGEKTIGTDINLDPVYKFDENFTTDASGRLTIEELEWDNYHFSLPESSGWDISGTNPLSPIPLLPDQNLDFAFALTPKTSHRLLAIFKDSAQNPIASVSARLSDEGGFEATASSGLESNPDFGQVFFANLENKNYLLEATASGFLDFQETIYVIDYVKEEIFLEQN